ncbi:hypothetical protein N8A98_22265 [Devosia neptuniae]|uniref:Fibronectin type-III domain-containing protein n=1 Tax=Devosia neptuniae TaxID=191302 RepID=A0ABY6CIM3_9HYPH|nr:hypothetical protein [Devosia neptuniae]UXN69898.1 hypothetical protein N8A98_22265 [Devosia neptuniae]
MPWPIVTVPQGGLPVTEATNGFGTPVIEAENGFGTAVTFVETGGLPVVGGASGELRYIAPTAQGSGDGTSWANAAALTSINTMIAEAGPGGTVAIASHLGDYAQTAPITLSAAGAAGNRVLITGMDGDGNPAQAKIVGNRTAWVAPVSEPVVPLDTSGYGGNTSFSAAAGISYLDFKNLRFERLGRIIDWSGIAATGFLFEDCEGFNVRDGFYTSITSAVTNLTLRRVTGEGFSKKFVRFHGDCSGWTIEDFSFDSRWQDKDNFAVGIECQHNAHGLIVRRGSAGNAHSTLTTYFNGDGMSSERTNYDILVEDATFYGCTDGGLDLKSERTIVRRVTANGNKRNFRVWGGVIDNQNYGGPILLEDCVSIAPHGRGGGSTHHAWLKGNDLTANGGSVSLSGFIASGGDVGIAALAIEGQNGTMAFTAPDIILSAGSVMHNTLEAGSIITGISGDPMAPAQFTAGQWTLASNNISGQLVANVIERPGDGGSVITSLQYRIDGGAWVTMAGTGTGPRVITSLTDGVEYDVELRAGNAIGFGVTGDLKSATPIYVAPVIVRLAFNGSALNPGDTPVDTAAGAPAMTLQGTAAVVAGGIQFGGLANHIVFPNREGFTFDGLFTVKMRLTKANWNSSAEQFLVAFWNTSGNQRAWMISINAVNAIVGRFCPGAGGSANIVDTVANGSLPAPITAGMHELMMDRGADGYTRIYLDGVMVGKSAAPVVGTNVNNTTNIVRVSGSTTGNADPGPSILHFLEVRKGEALCGSDAGYTP